ncbi:MAG: DUF4401 domain-containing protein [Rhodocyclaceae bacterium]|nr:DUF4401 domain-containing protein [Rhodocyclaceae bacterium]MCA3082024.1 DUF4401 domain-containing protein [Rhodocyclaceae bacterium]
MSDVADNGGLAIDAERLYAHLQSRGLLATAGDAQRVPPMLDDEAEESRPWFISLLVGAGGWFAGLMMLFAVALVFKPTGSIFFYVIAVLLFAAARAMFSDSIKGVFSSQLGLSLSLAGQAAMLVALTESLRNVGGLSSMQLVSFVLMLMQIWLVFLMPNYLHRLMSTLFACIAWAVATHFQGEGLVEAAMGGRTSESLNAGRMIAFGAGAWLLAWMPVLAAAWWAATNESKWVAAGQASLMRPVMLGLLIGGACATCFSSPFAYGFASGGAGVPGPNWIAMWPLLSILAALVMLCTAFRLQSRAGVGFCILAALAHVGHLYYMLNITLLTKSVVMLVIGGVCIAILKLRSHRADGSDGEFAAELGGGS